MKVMGRLGASALKNMFNQMANIVQGSEKPKEETEIEKLIKYLSTLLEYD